MRAGALVLLVGMLLGLVVGPASCSNDDDSSTTSTTTSSPPSPEAEVEAAYLAYWEMGARLLEAPDPEDPEIPERTSGTALTNLVAGLERLQASGQRSELGPNYSHEVLEVRLDGDDRATVEDCAVDDSRLIDANTSEVAEESIVTELLQATMIRRDGQWRVEGSSSLDAWEGAVPCR